MIVNRGTKRLNQENISFSYIFLEANKGIVVAKLKNIALSKGYTQVLTNIICEFRVGITGENLKVFKHWRALS